MPIRPNRDYQSEYRRRIASAAKRGLSRSQGRGHARVGEAGVRPSLRQSDRDRFEAALKLYRQGGNQSAAAKALNLAPERLRRFLRENVQVERSGRTLNIIDSRPREMIVISAGEMAMRVLRDRDQASLNGEYLNAVKCFLNTNDVDVLAPFERRAVIDAKGKSYSFETNPNTLHRLVHAGDEVFHEIYRLVI